MKKDLYLAAASQLVSVPVRLMIFPRKETTMFHYHRIGRGQKRPLSFSVQLLTQNCHCSTYSTKTSPSARSRRLLNTSRDGDSMTSLSNVLWCLTTLKIFFLISNLNLSSQLKAISSCPFTVGIAEVLCGFQDGILERSTASSLAYLGYINRLKTNSCDKAPRWTHAAIPAQGCTRLGQWHQPRLPATQSCLQQPHTQRVNAAPGGRIANAPLQGGDAPALTPASPPDHHWDICPWKIKI